MFRGYLMSRDKTRIRSIVKSMKQLGASEEEIGDYVMLHIARKPHALAGIRSAFKIFRSEGW